PWTLAAAAADTAFALAAAAGLAVPLWRSRNRRNYFLVALLLGLGAANLAFYLAKEDLLDMPVGEGLQIALDLILFIMTVMGGRVIPMFTMNAVPGAKGTRLGWLERLALGSVLLLVAADVVGLPEKIIAIVAGAAALAHAARLALWQPWLTLKRPIVWILHAAYAWIPIHLALRALAAVDVLPANLATHALTVGAIGGLTLGMMTRTARGHTGRSLQTGAAETACYALVQLAAVARVFVPLAAPQFFAEAVALSGVLWAIAFALFTVTYWPILTRPRADGGPG
ncbi:MAG: NnrS family protein, partial [Burkholderiales bacterium]